MTTKPQCPYCHAHTPTDQSGRLIYHTVPCLGYPPNTGLARSWDRGFQAEARILRAMEAERERDELRSELLTLRAEVDAMRAERVAVRVRARGEDCDSPGIYIAPEVCSDACWPETYPTHEDGPDCDGPGDPPAQADCDEVNHG